MQFKQIENPWNGERAPMTGRRERMHFDNAFHVHMHAIKYHFGIQLKSAAVFVRFRLGTRTQRARRRITWHSVVHPTDCRLLTSLSSRRFESQTRLTSGRRSSNIPPAVCPTQATFDSQIQSMISNSPDDSISFTARDALAL